MHHQDDIHSNFPELDDLKWVSFKSLVYFMVAPTLCYQVLLTFIFALKIYTISMHGYSLFMLRLNILAELLRFGDREFYKDWWNAKTIDEVVRHVDLLLVCFLS
ncbi:hypothetical protein BHE74_00021355 [Ensete ventricosum]|nr:hypothetical protein BHE74_00021355 [Ensete ventricosum]